MLLNNQLGNREPQTIATHLRLLHVVRLVKTLKNMLAILHRNTKTRIDHRDQREPLIIGTGTNNHRALGRREFDRIGHQVIQHLFHALGIDIEQRGGCRNIFIDHHSSLARLGLQAGHHLPHQHV